MADILNNADKGANVDKVTVTGTDGKFGSVNLTNLASVLGESLTSSTKIKYVNFAQRYSGGRIIAPFKYIGGGSHECCLFPIFSQGDQGGGLGLSLIYLENYSVGGQNNNITNYSGGVWTTDGQTSDGRAKLKITSSGTGWTYFIPWVMWTSGPHWTQYYDMNFEVY